MVLNPEPQTVELAYAGQTVSLTETSAGFYNERQHVAISLEKAMETNDLFGIGKNGEISSVTFGLYADEVLVAADGSEISAGGLIEIVTVSAKASYPARVICLWFLLPAGDGNGFSLPADDEKFQ